MRKDDKVKEVVRSWIELFEPYIVGFLGPMPDFFLTGRVRNRMAFGMARTKRGGAPWAVLVGDRKIWFIFNAHSIYHHFIAPTLKSAPHPDPLGRCIIGLLHDITHIYQAAGLYKNNKQRFFNHDGFNLAICGLAEYAAFEIGCHIWRRSSVGENRKGTQSLILRNFSKILEESKYCVELGEALAWRTAYSCWTARNQGWFKGRIEDFPLIKMLPEELRGYAKNEIIRISCAGEEPKKKFAVYDLGAFVGALLRFKGLELRDMINNPLSDKTLLGLAGIDKKPIC